MVLTAYLDESGTHAGAEVSAMAGFVGNARQWRKYEKRTAGLFKRYGVKVFHAIDVRRGHGDFKGWTVDRKIEFLDEFQHIINDTLESGVVSFIRDEDNKYYSGLHWPKKPAGILSTPLCSARALPRSLMWSGIFRRRKSRDFMLF
jgi:hypothetical protein